MFGDVVRGHRRRLSLTQEELAARAGITTRTIGNLEAGRVGIPRPATVRLLADAFDLRGADRDQFCAQAAAEQGVSPQPEQAQAAGERQGGAEVTATERDHQPLPKVLDPARFTVTPRQLPAAPAHFTGRDGELLAMQNLLAKAAQAQQPGSPLMLAICGMAGVGKTALALRWAHLVQSSFPDGQLYVDLRGFDPCGQPREAADVLQRILTVLGVAPEHIPSDVDARSALSRTLLSQRRMLVVLDNARDAAQVRPLLPGATHCVVVITSRDRLSGLISQGCTPFELYPLSTEQSLALLGRRLGEARLEAEPEAVTQILRGCGGLPLALAIVAARAATSPLFQLSTLAQELRHTQNTPEAFSGRDRATDLRTVFSWSYATLGPVAARLFRLSSLHGGPDLGPQAAAALLGCSAGDAKQALAELVDVHLISELAGNRYWMHDLLRAYAAELLSTVDSSHDRGQALHRLLDHYLHSSHAAATVLHPSRDAIDIENSTPGVPINAPGEVGPAFAWFTQEHRALLGALEVACHHGLHRHAWQLAWTLEVYFNRAGHWHDWAATQQIALRAATVLQSRAGQARAYRGIGTANIRLHRHHDALHNLEHALTLFAELGDDVGMANTHYHLGRLCEVMGRHGDMLTHSTAALRLFRKTHNSYGQARALNLVGWQHTLTGAHQEAVTYCRQALRLHIEADHRRGQADAYDSLGHANYRLGHLEEAIACYNSALAIYREVGVRYSEAFTLIHVGDIHLASGDLDGARAAWQAAAGILTDLDHPDLDKVRSRIHKLSEPARSR